MLQTSVATRLPCCSIFDPVKRGWGFIHGWLSIHAYKPSVWSFLLGGYAVYNCSSTQLTEPSPDPCLMYTRQPSPPRIAFSREAGLSPCLVLQHTLLQQIYSRPVNSLCLKGTSRKHGYSRHTLHLAVNLRITPTGIRILERSRARNTSGQLIQSSHLHTSTVWDVPIKS